ncbi:MULTISPECIES: hypothetical protein [unclassified Modicisalibacter]|uniref:hypothetical protein n=1 Tax=unclassified Modicisalibacter TaxID=2679913 RepID=UPI001CCCE9BE|nr:MULTISPECIES: hypothetical protein [unclassified Modicisalibacter]MBZ9556625.1 hypothetical protein [Modicisalibacter sp. R2A 31.J]MBZ9574906.1 hypothetical protein [Modicisalibacter sp. MOD 31.J]
MPILGVLTGDVVGSQQIPDKERLRDVLESALALVESRFQARSDRYRGDGFQVALPTPAQAMTAAVLIRSALIQESASRQTTWDARIAVAAGEGTLPAEGALTDAQGPAFVLSGHCLDALADTDRRLAVALPDAFADPALTLLTRFADDIIGGWSRYSAEVAYHSLLHEESQQSLARRLGRAQPTINRRLAAARWPLIRDYIAFIDQCLSEVEP